MTHAIVLIEAERSAIERLGGALADVDGRGRGVLGDRRVGLRRDLRVREPQEVAEVVTHRFGALEGIRRTHTMVAFEVFSQHDLEALFSIGH